MKNFDSEMAKIANLSRTQLKRLRRDIVLCSIYYSDYKNRYGIDEKTTCLFFDGYADYLGEFMEEDGKKGKDRDYFDNLEDYDNAENLQAWQACVACGLSF